MSCSHNDSVLLLTQMLPNVVEVNNKPWSSETCVRGVNPPGIRKNADAPDSYENVVLACFHPGEAQTLPAWTIDWYVEVIAATRHSTH